MATIVNIQHVIKHIEGIRERWNKAGLPQHAMAANAIIDSLKEATEQDSSPMAQDASSLMQPKPMGFGALGLPTDKKPNY